MLIIAANICFAALGAAMALNLWRLVRGPAAPDRILALDTLTINAIALILLLGVRQAGADYFDAALILAAMGFVGTAALCKFILSGDIIH
jgi:multicomponent K+:H+ antiporter subunit F